MSRLVLALTLGVALVGCLDSDDADPASGSGGPSDSLGLSGIGGGGGNGGGGDPGPGQRPVGAEGGACYGNGTCDTGLACVEGRCVAVIEDGGGLGEPCRSGGVCDAGLECAAGVCVEPAAAGGGLGEPCLSGDLCDAGLACTAGLCEWPSDPPGELGGPCFGNGTCTEDLVCVGDRCVLGEDDTGEVGAPCGEGLTPCISGLICRGGLCRPDAPAVGGEGQPCRSGDRCDPGLVCEAGTCAPAPSTPSGEPSESSPPQPSETVPSSEQPSGSASVPTDPEPSVQRPRARAGCRLRSGGEGAPFIRALRVDPGDEIECTCEESSAPAGDEVEFCDWTVLSPRDSLLTLEGTPWRTVRFTPTDIGAHEVCLSVATYEGRRSTEEDCVIVETSTDSEILCRLTWEHAFGGWTDPLDPSAAPFSSRGCGGDLDIHALPSTEGNWFTNRSAYFASRSVQWSGAGEAALLEDVRFGVGPETIAIRNPVAGVTYTCAAHYWSDYGWAQYPEAGGWADATMEIYVNGVLVREFTRRMPGTYTFWEAAHITWRAPLPSDADIRSSSTVHASHCETDRSETGCTRRGATNPEPPCWQ